MTARSDGTGRSLQDALDEAASPVALLRDLGVGRFTAIPDEYTHWIEEQRAWRETCALFDLSYHMSDLEVEGPDKAAFVAAHAVNDVSAFEPGDAKQLVVCSPDGYFIGDAIITNVGDERYVSVGPQAGHNWLDYRAEVTDLDVSVSVRGRPVATGEDPVYFRYQVQGPDAPAVVAAATDGDLGDVPFFATVDRTIADTTVHVLRHGMAGEPGFECWGPYEAGDAVREALLAAGEDHGLRRVGARSYQVTAVISGWLPLPVPAIYTGEAMRDYREWLDARRGLLSIGGSFDAPAIEDYYVTPVELGYGRHIDFDHEFVGREALREHVADPGRTKVTLVWDPDDVVDVFASLFREGETGKFLDLPTPRTAACHYDRVLADGEPAGVSKWMNYAYNERAMLSLALVDTDVADPGTEVELVWGEAGGAANPQVERHAPTTIGATVAEAPYVEDRR